MKLKILSSFLSILLILSFIWLLNPNSVFSQTIQGDLDKDGDVDIFDYNLLVQNFGQTGSNVADIDGNLKVDIFDYNILVSNFGKTSATPTPAQPSPTPPPTSMLFGCPSIGYTRLVSVNTATQLASALSGAQPGDQIRLATGTYSGPQNFFRSGTANSPIFVCGNPGVWPVIKGGGQSQLNAAYITITGVVFSGPTGGVNLWISGGHDINFVHNEVKDSNGHAGVSVDGTYNLKIMYNYFHNNGSADIDHGIYYRAQATTPSTRNLIANNLFTTSGGRGISMHDNGGGAINYTTVTQNTSVRNGSHGILVDTHGGVGDEIVGNIVADNGYKSGHNQIEVRTGGGGEIRNNIVWSPNSSVTGIQINSGTSYTVSGNLTQDPRFVAPYTNLHLQAGSPAIGLALPGYSVSPDYDGKNRDSAPDAGAYEF